MLALRHIVEYLKHDTHILKTLAVGEVSSAAGFILSFGTRGERRAIRHARLLYHFSRRIFPAATAQTLNLGIRITHRPSRFSK